jgi:hypothetical protein
MSTQLVQISRLSLKRGSDVGDESTEIGSKFAQARKLMCMSEGLLKFYYGLSRENSDAGMCVVGKLQRICGSSIKS